MLPPGFGYEWTEIAYQEEPPATPAMLVFGASAVFVFLVLAAQYESWELPLVGRADRADVPARLGHRAAVPRHAIDILAQIGFVVLVGLAAKNAILIVEFARQARGAGRGPLEAAVAGGAARGCGRS